MGFVTIIDQDRDVTGLQFAIAHSRRIDKVLGDTRRHRPCIHPKAIGLVGLFALSVVQRQGTV